jgi:hypothetical protein
MLYLLRNSYKSILQRSISTFKFGVADEVSVCLFLHCHGRVLLFLQQQHVAENACRKKSLKLFYDRPDGKRLLEKLKVCGKMAFKVLITNYLI